MCTSGGESQVLLDGERAAGSFEWVPKGAADQACQAMLGPSGHVLFVDGQTAAIDRGGAGEAVEQVALAGAVAADHGDEVAALHQ